MNKKMRRRIEIQPAPGLGRARHSGPYFADQYTVLSNVRVNVRCYTQPLKRKVCQCRNIGTPVKQAQANSYAARCFIGDTRSSNRRGAAPRGVFSLYLPHTLHVHTIPLLPDYRESNPKPEACATG